MSNERLAVATPPLLANYARQLPPVAVTLALIVLFGERLFTFDLIDILATMKSASVQQWCLAGLATVISFAALGRTEANVHAWLNLPTDARVAGRIGCAGVAIAQTTGLGLLSGTLVRWRCGLSLTNAFRATFAVSGVFLAILAVVAAIAVLSGDPRLFELRPLAVLVVVSGLGLATCCFLARGPWARLLPGGLSLARLVFWVAVDVMAACLAFWIFVPDLSFALLAPVFLIALAAGLISALPGGLGAFEITLLMLIPHVPGDALLGAALCFRLVYFLVPAVVAAPLILFRPGLFKARKHGLDADITTTQKVPETAERAEAGLLRQPGAVALTRWGHPVGLVWPGRTALALIGAPFDTQWRDTLLALRNVASAKGRVPMAYKIPAPMALVARRDGWAVLRTGREALVCRPNDGTKWLEGSRFRQLRRKIRQAEKAGITIQRAQNIPFADLTHIDEAWQRRNGGARGISMGRLNAAYVRDQIIWAAYQNDTPIAFATFHQNRTEQTLDLMRSTDETPDGTMHLLVAHAIRAAFDQDFQQVSLASVPDLPGWMTARDNSAGLDRFKSAFAPRWSPLYTTAPNRWMLALGLCELLRLIDRPPATLPNAPHDLHENRSIALTSIS